MFFSLPTTCTNINDLNMVRNILLQEKGESMIANQNWMLRTLIQAYERNHYTIFHCPFLKQPIPGYFRSKNDLVKVAQPIPILYQTYTVSMFSLYFHCKVSNDEMMFTNVEIFINKTFEKKVLIFCINEGVARVRLVIRGLSPVQANGFVS